MKRLLTLVAALALHTPVFGDSLYRTPMYDSYSPDGYGAGKSYQDSSGNLYKQKWRPDNTGPVTLEDESGNTYRCNAALGQCYEYWFETHTTPTTSFTCFTYKFNC